MGLLCLDGRDSCETLDVHVINWISSIAMANNHNWKDAHRCTEAHLHITLKFSSILITLPFATFMRDDEIASHRRKAQNNSAHA